MAVPPLRQETRSPPAPRIESRFGSGTGARRESQTESLPGSRFAPPAVTRLDALRARIRTLERGAGAAVLRSLPLDAAALDAHLPGGGLQLGALHEIEGERAEWDDGVASGFCLAVLARLMAVERGRVLWVSRHSDLYMPGLVSLGLDPARLLLVQARDSDEIAWAMEEGLRCPSLAAVVGETEGLSRQAGRRLQLAAEQGGVTAFALGRRLRPRRDAGPSAAATRWRVSAAPAARRGGPGFPTADFPTANFASDEVVAGWGAPRWRLELLRCRGAAPAAWLLDWSRAAKGEKHAPGGFALATTLCDGPSEAGDAPHYGWDNCGQGNCG